MNKARALLFNIIKAGDEFNLAMTALLIHLMADNR